MTTASEQEPVNGEPVLKRSTWLLELKAQYAEEYADKLRAVLRRLGNPEHHRYHNVIGRMMRRAAGFRAEAEASKDMPCCMKPELVDPPDFFPASATLFCKTCGAARYEPSEFSDDWSQWEAFFEDGDSGVDWFQEMGRLMGQLDTDDGEAEADLLQWEGIGKPEFLR